MDSFPPGMGDTLNGSWGTLNFQVPLGEGGLAKWGCHVFSFLFFFFVAGGGGGQKAKFVKVLLTYSKLHSTFLMKMYFSE